MAVATGVIELYFGFIMTILQASHLSKSFKSRGNRHIITGLWRPEWQHKLAVNDISFSVEAGESVAFLGPNGAGKTTTTKMMSGLISPTSGQVRVLDYDPFQRHPDFLRQIGLVMGNKAGLNWDLTAKQSFWLLQNIYEVPAKRFNQRVAELTAMLEVADLLNVQVRRLSLGERMKLELIGAILHQPKVLFLDEPTIGLDITAKKNIRLFLRKIQQEDAITLVLTSHDMDDVEQVCDRVLVINHGQKIYDDRLAALLQQYKTQRYVRLVFDQPPSADHLARYGEVLKLDHESALLQISAETMVRAVSEISNTLTVVDMHIESVPLEEIIEDVFKRRGVEQIG
jgi:ABC-2 type transport system ATP-binding protein